MTVRIREQPYHDAVGRAYRRRRRTRHIARAVIGVIFVFAVLWTFLFSSLFAVTDIIVFGAASVGDDNVARTVRGQLAQRQLYVFQPLRNIILLEGATIADHVKGVYSAIEAVAVEKQYPHTIKISVTERQPVGIWCREQACEFWDRTGARWGNPVPSVGPLLLRVQDERDEDAIDVRMFTNILAVVDALPDLGLHARSIRLPNGEPGGVRIMTDRKYDVYLDALGDVTDQLDVLGIFLADRAKDTAFSPQYIDLRTPGRVYYK